MSSRGQANSIRSKKTRERQTSHARDNSQESIKSETEPTKPQPRSREDGRRKEVPRSKTNKSPRKMRGNKDINAIEKSPSSRSLSGRKEDKKGRNDNQAHEKGRESNKSPVLGLFIALQLILIAIVYQNVTSADLERTDPTKC